jgi:hypothetical protein
MARLLFGDFRCLVRRFLKFRLAFPPRFNKTAKSKLILSTGVGDRPVGLSGSGPLGIKIGIAVVLARTTNISFFPARSEGRCG